MNIAECVCLRWSVSWTSRTNQLLLHVAHEGSSARTQGGADLQDDSGELTPTVYASNVPQLLQNKTQEAKLKCLLLETIVMVTTCCEFE